MKRLERDFMTPLLLVSALIATSAAENRATPSLPPMPSDAECRPLPNLKTPLTFGPGESLEYDLDSMGAKAGRMTLKVKPQSRSRLPVEVEIETNSFFSKFRRVRGMGTSFLNTQTLRPLRYLEEATEGAVHRTADVTFAPRSVHLVSTLNDQRGEADFNLVGDGFDVAGAIYMMRQLPLKAGQAVCFDVYGIRRIWRVWGTVAPRERVQVPVGEFDAWHISGHAVRIDHPAVRREVHVWLSDDAKRLPLAALGAIDLGAVRATLTNIHRPGDTAARAESKGNIKW
jgi:hypothetical protein